MECESQRGGPVSRRHQSTASCHGARPDVAWPQPQSERRFSACRLPANVFASWQLIHDIYIWSTRRSKSEGAISAVDPASVAARRALEELCAALQRLPGSSSAQDNGAQRRDRRLTSLR